MAIRPLASILVALAASACGTRTVAVHPIPPAALLLPCTIPKIDGNTGTDASIALTILDLAKSLADCRERHADLAKWVREAK